VSRIPGSFPTDFHVFLFRPAAVLPSPDQFTVAVRFCPLLFELRDTKSPPFIPLPYRMIYAVATKCSVYLYDTQQKIPFGLISNIHYTRLTDLAWSNDGNTLLVSSTDGYCSIVQFNEGELGKVYTETTIQEILATKTAKEEPKKKKKSKRPKKESKSPSVEVEAKENVEQMEVDEPAIADISLTNLPESIKEKIPVDKIIKSTEIFSPEKQVGSPATPIQVRKFPRNLEEAVDALEKKVTPPRDEDAKPIEVVTPKSFNFHHHKTPTPIEVRRVPRVLQPQVGRSEGDEWPKPVTESPKPKVLESPMDRKLPNDEKTTPKTPRRIELQTISTPKSKKKLL
jgi:chromatin assembly factor 1 subunit B